MEKKNLLNYETLFEYLREERRNVSLQVLPETFFADVAEYIAQKETLSPGAEQLKNARKIIEDIYERREKKISTLALNKSRTNSPLIDTTNLLPEEKVFFKQLVVLLDHFRDEILKNVLDKTAPNIGEKITDVVPDTPVVIDYRYRCLRYIDKFVGPDLEILGPFEEGAVVELDRETADILISKNLVEPFKAE